MLFIPNIKFVDHSVVVYNSLNYLNKSGLTVRSNTINGMIQSILVRPGAAVFLPTDIGFDNPSGVCYFQCGHSVTLAMSHPSNNKLIVKYINNTGVDQEIGPNDSMIGTIVVHKLQEFQLDNHNNIILSDDTLMFSELKSSENDSYQHVDLKYDIGMVCTPKQPVVKKTPKTKKSTKRKKSS